MIVQGSGEPLPSLSWRREGGPLPDGDMPHYNDNDDDDDDDNNDDNDDDVARV